MLLLETFIQQLINGLSLGSVYALIAVGYSLVYSVLLFSNFAHGGFLVIGGYICYYALRSGGANIWIASFAALVGAGISAIVVERLAYRPIRERTPITLLADTRANGIPCSFRRSMASMVRGSTL